MKVRAVRRDLARSGYLEPSQISCASHEDDFDGDGKKEALIVDPKGGAFVLKDGEILGETTFEPSKTISERLSSGMFETIAGGEQLSPPAKLLAYIASEEMCDGDMSKLLLAWSDGRLVAGPIIHSSGNEVGYVEERFVVSGRRNILAACMRAGQHTEPASQCVFTREWRWTGKAFIYPAASVYRGADEKCCERRSSQNFQKTSFR